MVTRTLAVTSGALLAALLAPAAAAAPVISTEYRYASQVSEYFVRGDAAVSESAVLRRGLRLAAWDAENEEEATRVGVATAVYLFQVPLAARTVTIEVAYQVDKEAANRDVAGFLFVRNKAVEDQYAGAVKEGKRPVEEPGFFGNIYLLPAKEPRVAITLPTDNHVIDGVLEVHLSAGAGQVFDAQYVQVTSFAAEVPVQVQYAAADHYIPNPYDYSYLYYYGGPCYYPMGAYYACFQPFSLDPIFWYGWYSRRACYYVHHRWHHRPRHYIHLRPIIVYRPVYIINPVIHTYRSGWYRRHFALDGDLRRYSDQDLDRIVRRRVEVLSSENYFEQRRQAHAIAQTIRQSEADLRSRLGDRFRDHLDAWHRNPAQAARELRSDQHTPAIHQAAARWAAARSPKPQDLHPPRDKDRDGRRPEPDFNPTVAPRPSSTIPAPSPRPTERPAASPPASSARPAVCSGSTCGASSPRVCPISAATWRASS